MEFEVSGRQARESAKLSYNIKLPKKSYLYGYRRLKLRALDTDPSYIREALGFKMLRSAGVPTTDFSFVRYSTPLLFLLRRSSARKNLTYPTKTLYQ